jgi:hypothetical protein
VISSKVVLPQFTGAEDMEVRCARECLEAV